MSRQQPKSVAIIGAGLAGAACANAFAHAGLRVVVYEQGAAPAAGASGVPIAMFAPSISADDAPHSRLLRNGVNLLLQQLKSLTEAGLLSEGEDWAMTGVVERCIRSDKRLPSTWLEPYDPIGLQSIMLERPYSIRPAGRVPELFHPAAGWVHTKRLIAAWLAHPNIQLQTNSPVHAVSKLDADVVVVACGYQSSELLPALKSVLQPIRGQVEWGERRDFDKLSPNGLEHSINGMGHFIQASNTWLAGATFQRDEFDLAPRAKDVDLNFEKLEALLPEFGKPYLARLRAHSTSWVGVRVAQKNRQPLVAQVDPYGYPNLWVCTGLGSRGLSLAALCAASLLASTQHRLTLG